MQCDCYDEGESHIDEFKQPRYRNADEARHHAEDERNGICGDELM